MSKKITPDPPAVRKTLSTADRSLYLRKLSDEPEPVPTNPPRLLDTLAFTCSKPVTPEAPYKPTLFAIQPGVNAHRLIEAVSK
ncbi:MULTISPECIES: hypothetical protein [unclassified Pseudomonas]|uniref:hypothetical protein n=1 Tax=unclassified Pseudomonas TaxID=196821 RepID=UPI00128D4F60|nr:MULTISPECIES: hypothetical protein [unclassified Pseudomonas]MPQ69207.1 hypothetical protein [Pseudomonas sp. MWU12-2323]